MARQEKPIRPRGRMQHLGHSWGMRSPAFPFTPPAAGPKLPQRFRGYATDGPPESPRTSRVRPPVSRNQQPTVALVSLGCPKNLVDSERMLAVLALGGFAVTTDPDGADVAVVNTCAFIDLARAESDQHLDELESLKRHGRLGRVVVAGCMVQRYGRQILRRHPGVDAIVGVADREALADVCRQVLKDAGGAGPGRHGGSAHRKARDGRHGSKGRRGDAGASPDPIVCVGMHLATPPDDRERLRLTPRHYAYLRVSEGCDNRCAYCAIPEIRGPLRSKPPELILAEAHELVADGAQELILIGQDTTAYGRDFAPGVAPDAKPWTLGRLVATLREEVSATWIRLMYAHPASFADDVIEQLAAGLPVVPYVDLPLQHANDAILASMGRRVGRAEIERLIARLRQAAPGVAIRTSFIVGYPGETDEQFEELAEFVRKVRFDQVGVFVYSAETGTRAADLPDPVPHDVARRRWERLMELAEGLGHEAALERRGQALAVLVDGADASGRLIARHAGQAPEVDSVTLLPPGAAEVGRMVTVRVTGAEGYDLVAEVVPGRSAGRTTNG